MSTITRRQYRTLELLMMNADKTAPVSIFKDILGPLEEMGLICTDGKNYWACYETFVALLEERPPLPAPPAPGGGGAYAREARGGGTNTYVMGPGATPGAYRP